MSSRRAAAENVPSSAAAMKASSLAGVRNAWLRPAAPVRSTIATGRQADAELRTMWSGLPGLPTDCDEFRRAVRRRAFALNIVGAGSMLSLPRVSTLSGIRSLTVILLDDPTAPAVANGVTGH
jgi:hypothetical protein